MPPIHRLASVFQIASFRLYLTQLARAARNRSEAIDRAVLRGGGAAREAVTLNRFLRSPITVSFLIALGLFMPEQSREVYRSLAELPQDNFSVIIFTAVLVVTLSLLLLVISAAILISLKARCSTIFGIGLVVLISSLPRWASLEGFSRQRWAKQLRIIIEQTIV